MLYSYQIREIAEKLYSARGGSSVSTLDVENYIKYNCPYMTEISSSDVSDVLREYNYIADEKRSQTSVSENYSSNNWGTTNNASGDDYYDEENFFDDYSAPTYSRASYSTSAKSSGRYRKKEKPRFYCTCVLQVLVVIASVCTFVFLGIAFFNNDLYNGIVEASSYFLAIIIGEIVLHRVLAKPLYYKWCTELNMWTVATMFVLYHFYLVATLEPSSSLGDVAQAIVIGEILNIFLCQELSNYDDGLVWGICGLAYFCLPIVSAFCHEEDMFYTLFRGMVFVALIGIFVMACLFTSFFRNSYKTYREQPDSFFDKRCKTIE